MKQITQEEFNAIMDSHEKWLKNKAEGQQALFSNIYGVGIVAKNRSFDETRFVDSSFVDSSFVGSSFDDSRFVGSRFDETRFDGSRFDGSSFSTLNFNNAKNDFFATLLYLPSEVAALKAALIEGRIDGSQYEGECACLKGTLERVAKKEEEEIGWKHDVSAPAETFFLSISQGDTPENSRFSALAVQWIEEWCQLPVVKMALARIENV